MVLTPHDAYAENWDYDPGQTSGTGSHHTISGDGPDEEHSRVRALRKVVEEITGKPLPKATPEARKIGFY